METLALEFPTIIFWNPKFWELRDTEKPYFEKLREVGILHFTPESAAKKINEISTNLSKWWNDNDVEYARNEFCNRYVRTSDNWFIDWRNVLLRYGRD